MDAPAPVTQIGKYPILDVLGVGGMGVVYRGVDKSVGREVAIKTLTAATDELRQRFLLEARSGILNHPNIVTVYDSGEQDGMPYIVMEFVRGDSLENLLRSGREFSLIEKLDMVHQMCLGLGYAHRMGVVHRDIKPANIMLQPDGHIKIVDFGVARLENLSGHTQTGMVIGTFHYISPERLLGKAADGRADVWSAGVILYRLLAGRLPFPGDDISILQKVIHEPYDPLRNILEGYPGGIDQVLERALAKKPDERYETADDMASDIEAINGDLKREHVGEVLGNVKQLMEQEQWTSVRPVLLDLQRLNPQNTDVKRLLREVQGKLSVQQKTVQLQQLLGNAEEAVLSQRYAEALELYNQATGIDPTSAVLIEKFEHARGLKEKADKVATLLGQSREARRRNDFGAASDLIDRALQLDERNTDLRNERARIIQEAEKSTRERKRREFSDAAQGQLAARQYTEAIKSLRSALEIDPTDSEIQQMYQSALERQEENRRRAIIEKIVSEISNCIAGEDFERALSLIQRAQEHLPGETVLFQLKTEAETGLRDRAATKLVEKTSLDVSNLFVSDPSQALAVVQQALEQMPGEPRLIALEEKVLEQTRKARTEELKSQYLKRAQVAIDASQFDEATQILEAATIDCGEIPEIASLLNYAREHHRKAEQGHAAATAMRDAKALIASGDFASAIALLQKAATDTGDPAVQQLLRQTTASQAELGRRVEAALGRAQALSATNNEQALQLLASQPAEVQQDARVIELRAKLESSKDQDRQGKEKGRQIDVAVREATATLERGDLRGGLGVLEAAKARLGNSPLLSAAIADCKARRAQIANEWLNTAIASATQSMLQEDRKQAAETLSRVTDAAEFADPALQATLKDLTKEAAKSSPRKPAKTAPEPASTVTTAPAAAAPITVTPAAKAKSGAPMGILIGVLLLVLVGGAGAGYWFFLRPKPVAPAAPVVPVGVLEISATPFGTVVSITSDKGKPIPLPDGDPSTPMRVEGIADGSYTVVVKGADGSTQTQSCNAADSPQVCVVTLQPIDDKAIEEIIGGAK